jgi:pilus assembly protein CpaF
MLNAIMNNLLATIGSRARDVALTFGLSAREAAEQALDELAEESSLQNEPQMLRQAISVLSGYGPLEPYLADPSVEELWMNRPDELFIHVSGRTEKRSIDFSAEQQEIVIDRMLRTIGRRIDRFTPFVDAPLPDGSRLHVVIPDVTRANLSFNIRRFTKVRSSLQTLCSEGVLSANQLDELQKAMISGETVLISGATAAGKTTFLCALLAELPADERIVTVEDTFEIQLANEDWVAMQTRSESIEGAGSIDLRRLIREALRMRPGRLVVGEVRGAEAIELLVALNSGIPALCTVHANSARQAITKMLTLPLLSGVSVPVEFVEQVIGSSVGYIAHCELGADGTRRLRELLRVSQGSEGLVFEPID